jgi:hypothetical protein
VALTAQNDQLMAEGDDSKEPFQMIATLDLQTLYISVRRGCARAAGFEVRRLRLSNQR